MARDYRPTRNSGFDEQPLTLGNGTVLGAYSFFYWWATHPHLASTRAGSATPG